MARMLPPEVSADTKSNAEKKIFNLIRNDLGGEWVALHSVGLTVHAHKPWAEIDFVLLGPPGVFCLEVKGGRITREQGRYHFTDRNGVNTIKDQGPFEQVGPASAALYSYLIGRSDSLRDVAVGYGVVTPDIEFKIQGPNIERRVIFDERDLLKPFTAYVRRLTDYWHERLEGQGKRPRAVDEVTRQLIVDLLRGDFDLRPSLRNRIGRAKEELIRLTSEQYRIIDDLIENDRVIIRGGAGSGKTLLAIEEARRRAQAGERVFLTCYNASLGDDLRRSVSDIPNITAGHLHSYMAQQVTAAGLKSSLPPADEADLFQVFYPEVCLDAVLVTEEVEAYDSLIIDEAQDLLLDTYLNVFDALVKGGINGGKWRVFLDPYQDIFLGTSPAALNRLTSAHPAKYTLSINCRNTAPVALMTRLISSVPVLETLRVEGPEVKVHWYNDDRHLCELASKALNRLLGEHVKPADIVILGEKRLAVGCLKRGLDNVPFNITEWKDASDVIRSIRYSTIRAYKGLESDAVFLVGVDDLESQDYLYDLYVAGTRARAYMEVFMSEKLKSAYGRKAAEFAQFISGGQPSVAGAG